ncbi:MAG: hypothetical protein ACSHYA_17115 [Opitutaceae bacterium]
MKFVKISDSRPDFRAFISLLYCDDQSVDTDGDADPVSSGNWTYLYLADRESEDPGVDIDLCTHSDFFSVKSESTKNEEMAALYLYEYCGSELRDEHRPYSEKEISELIKKYSVELQRARDSTWNQSG